MKDQTFFTKNNLADHGESLFDHLPGFLYFVKDTKLRFVSCNQRLAEKIGATSPSEILGKTDHHLFPTAQADAYAKDDRQVLKTGTPIHNKVELVPRDAQGFVDWSTTTKIPLRDPNGKIVAIAGTTRPFATGITGIDIDSELGDTLTHMRQNYAQTLPVAELAKIAHLSISAFERKFKKHLHMTPRQYIRHLRVHEACYQLSHKNTPLSQIANHCGFTDQSHFSKEFSKIIKTTPLKYRNRHRAKKT